jgi:N-acetyl-anhydromuramyl-L-alanine amidase AmpD
MLNLSSIPFVQAKHYTKAARIRTEIIWIVLHCTDGPETKTRAEFVASWFADKQPNNPAPKASAHYAVDSDSIVQMVKDRDVAWHAPGANHNGIGIEHCGRAKQTRDEWLDDFGLKMFKLSAELTAALCNRYVIPRVFVSGNDLRNMNPGITTHHEINKVFKRSKHNDPGPGFPIDWYIEQVNAAFLAPVA